MQNYSDVDQVRRCLVEIEEKLSWGKATEWHNEVFLELSARIHEETSVLLSSTTLKRVWGRIQYDSAPSITTLNALAKFAGYENWRTFKMSVAKTEAAAKPKKSIKNLGVIVASAALLTVIFISFFSMIGPPPDQLTAADLSKIEFSSRTLSTELPNSVVFDFDLAGHTSDSMVIQQDWDVRKRIKLHAGQRQATGIYYIPGYFEAKLVLDNNVVRAHDLFVKSSGWLATVDYKPVPKYLKSTQILDQKLKLPSNIVDEISQSEKPINTTFHYVDDFESISGDNFNFSTTIKNTYREKWAVCQTTKILILGTTGVHIIPFSLPGCVSDINLMLHDNYLRGKENDLSAFGVDFSVPRNIGLDIVNKQVTISIDGVEVFQDVYQEEIGRLIGIRFRFTGAGEIQSLEVKDAQRSISELAIG